jgi:hypothetical protein
MTLEIHVLVWDRHKNVGVLNQLLMESHSSLYWISSDNTDIDKQEKRSAQVSFHSKRPHTITKMNEA